MAKAKASNNNEIQQKIRIKLKAYDNKVIDKSTKQIVETIIRYGGKVIGPVPLPTEIHKYTVNRSTFVHKNSREQFEMRVHKRLIDILNPGQKVIDALMNLTLPAGVDIEVKVRASSVVDQVLIAHRGIRDNLSPIQNRRVSFIKSVLSTGDKRTYKTFKYILYGAMFGGHSQSIIFRHDC